MQRFGVLAKLTVPQSIARIVPDDPDDDAVIACALAARANLIVSGDSHLLRLKHHQDIPIVGPAEAQRIIEQTG